MKEPKGLCDSSSKSYSGYLDIADDAHLFYWFFESRSKHPEQDPLVLWINGGPGVSFPPPRICLPDRPGSTPLRSLPDRCLLAQCSSTTGLLFELGPCSVTDGGMNTTYNPHSWTESANVIFLDSPVQVGCASLFLFLPHLEPELTTASISQTRTVPRPSPTHRTPPRTSTRSSSCSTKSSPSSRMSTSTSPVVRATLGEHPSLPAGADSEPRTPSESYAGTYLPNIASVIHNHNKKKPTPSSLSIPLKSVLIGNGLTDAYTQFASVPDWSCNKPGTPGANPYGPIFDEATCSSIRGKVPTCQRLTEFCYNNPSRFVSPPLAEHCTVEEG